MARTKTDISNEILAAIAASPTLSGAATTSQTSVIGQLRDVFASILQINDQLGDIQEARMNTIADEAVPGTPSWLKRQSLKFQYGDTIQLNTTDLTFSYPTVDPTKQIVTRCSVQQLDTTREVLIKLAKGVTGALAPLTAAELSAFKAYINRIKFAGTHLRPISLAADRIVVEYDVEYSGELIQSVVKTNVIAAINGYFQNLEFDGTVVLSKLTDAIQAVSGVGDVVLKSSVARPATVDINDPTLADTGAKYFTQAGYIIPEDATGYSLNDTLNLIAIA